MCREPGASLAARVMVSEPCVTGGLSLSHNYCYACRRTVLLPASRHRHQRPVSHVCQTAAPTAPGSASEAGPSLTSPYPAWQTRYPTLPDNFLDEQPTTSAPVTPFVREKLQTFTPPSVKETGTLRPSAEWYPAWMQYRRREDNYVFWQDKFMRCSTDIPCELKRPCGAASPLSPHVVRGVGAGAGACGTGRSHDEHGVVDGGAPSCTRCSARRPPGRGAASWPILQTLNPKHMYGVGDNNKSCDRHSRLGGEEAVPGRSAASASPGQG